MATSSQCNEMSELLHGVVALIEVGKDPRALQLRETLIALGATVVNHWSPLVTHVIWAEGGSSEVRAEAHASGVHVVSPLWVEACVTTRRHLLEASFPGVSVLTDLPSPSTLLTLLVKAEKENLPLADLIPEQDKPYLKRSRPEATVTSRDVQSEEENEDEGMPNATASANSEDTSQINSEDLLEEDKAAEANTSKEEAGESSASDVNIDIEEASTHRVSSVSPDRLEILTDYEENHLDSDEEMADLTVYIPHSRYPPSGTMRRLLSAQLREDSPSSESSSEWETDYETKRSILDAFRRAHREHMEENARNEAERSTSNVVPTGVFTESTSRASSSLSNSPTTAFPNTSSSQNPGTSDTLPGTSFPVLSSSHTGPSTSHLPATPNQLLTSALLPIITTFRPINGISRPLNGLTLPGNGPRQERVQHSSFRVLYARPNRHLVVVPNDQPESNEQQPGPNDQNPGTHGQSSGPGLGSNSQNPDQSGHQPGPSGHQPGPSGHQPGPSGHQPGPSDHQPGPSGHQSGPSDHQPDPSGHQPSPNGQHQDQRNQNPSPKNLKNGPQAGPKDQDPDPKNGQHPDLKNGSQPGRRNGQRPSQNSQRPGLNGQQPGQNGQRPGLNGQQPGRNGQRPGLNGQQSGLDGQRQGLNGQQPGLDGQRPGLNGQQPGRNGQRPGLNGQQPGLDGQRPGLNRQQRGWYVQQRGWNGQQRGWNGQQPGRNGQQRGWNGQQRGWNVQQQFWNGQQQGWNGQQQGWNGQQQGWTGQQRDWIGQRPGLLHNLLEMIAAYSPEVLFIDNMGNHNLQVFPSIDPIHSRDGKHHMILTGMSREERCSIYALLRDRGVEMQNRVDYKTTHVILGHFGESMFDPIRVRELDEDDYWDEDFDMRTVSALMGAARGCRVVTSHWVVDSAAEGCWLPCRPYSIPHLKAVSEKAYLERHAMGLMNADYKFNVFKGRRVRLCSDAVDRRAAEQLLAMCGAVVLDDSGRIVRNSRLATARPPSDSRHENDNLFQRSLRDRLQRARLQNLHPRGARYNRTQQCPVMNCYDGVNIYQEPIRYFMDTDKPVIVVGKHQGSLDSMWVFESVAKGRMCAHSSYKRLNMGHPASQQTHAGVELDEDLFYDSN